MKGQGRGTHPAAAVRIAINSINTWAQHIPYHDIPSLPVLEVLKVSIANEIVRELMRRGGPSTKELLKDTDFKPSSEILPPGEDPILRWVREEARAESIRWLTGQLEQSSFSKSIDLTKT
jgi:hypothetical protein